MTPGRILFRVSVFLALLCGSLLPAAATILNLNPIADTAIFQGSPNNNLGGHSNFLAGVVANGSIARGLLKFDPATSIPNNAIINSVTLTLTITPAPSQNATFE